MRTRSTLLAVCLFAGLTNLCASGPEKMMTSTNNGTTSIAPAGFEENKGQVRTTAGEAAPFVRYRLSQGNTHIFLLENGIAYQFNRQHYPAGYEALAIAAKHDENKQLELDALRDQVRLETFRMDMVLEGANPHPRITTTGRSSDYTNYYNHDVLDVHAYDQVTYHDVYPGIDWVVYTTEEGMKYDFIVQPGADPDMIRLRFKDHEELYVDGNGSLVHGNRMGRHTEESPISYQRGRAISTSFILDDNRLRFAIDGYDKGETLIVDPNRLWATYYGGSDTEFGNTCSVDGDGNSLLAGWTQSTNSIASSGHQIAYGGGNYDAFLVKFSPDGTRLWSTYYGGSGWDSGESCAVDDFGNIFLAGKTVSSSNISFNGFQNDYSDSFDAFLVKFSPSGTRIWGTYYGGNGADYGLSCAVDANQNVYMSGHTDSGSGISSSGGHQINLGGDTDGYLVKFASDGTRMWGTYYGGLNDDLGYGCAVDMNGNALLCGITESADNIASTGHQMTIAGGEDAFLVKFTSTGQREWGTYYGGQYSNRGYACAADDDGNAFLIGWTEPDDALVTPDGHQITYGGGGWDTYLVKFAPNGSRIWGTYYGGNEDDRALCCAVDPSGNVLLAGYTSSQDGIAHNGFQDMYGGGVLDAFLAKLGPTGTRVWGTYYGGASNDQGTSCAVGGNGAVFLAGRSMSDAGVASSGFQNSLFGDSDAMLVKFEDNEVGVGDLFGRDVLVLWPNPTSGSFFLSPSSETRVRELSVIDATGRVVLVQTTATSSDPISIDLGTYESGIYFVQVQFADGYSAVERVMKK